MPSPFTSIAPIYAANAKYVNGIAPGYWPTAGAGLVLNISAGTAYSANTIQNYAGGTLTMANNTTNYVYLDVAASCAPASNTTGFSGSTIPIATVVTSGGAITSITDNRTPFVAGPGSGSVDFTAFAPGLGVNAQIVLRIPVNRQIMFPAGAALSHATASVAATGSTTFTLTKNGTSFATINFAPSSATGTFTQGSNSQFAAGDILEIDGPATADATLTNVGITLAGCKGTTGTCA